MKKKKKPKMKWKRCNLLEEVHKELAKYYNSEEYRTQELKRANDIARLMSQVVGAEMY